MVKKAKRAHTEASPSAAHHKVSEDDRARFRYHYLLQDYEELLRETEAKKKNLQEAKQKKLRLLAEVEFLQRKYQSFLENPYQTSRHRMKKQSHKKSVLYAGTSQMAKLHVSNGVPSTGKTHTAVEASKPRASALLDLNQISSPSGEDAEEFRMHMESLRPETYSIKGGRKDRKLPICRERDVENDSKRASMRNITWQDPVALRVDVDDMNFVCLHCDVD
ncbi:hypothetical protein Cni_G15177 [Canna indica]|uniref:Uncharacterized protein n=1 Tax=Canna indica TaxID=4628 RepID=A0AAQ3KGD5_9LILI|nr:hypothetical protein Cni_G15177 [Canna indica]